MVTKGLTVAASLLLFGLLLSCSSSPDRTGQPGSSPAYKRDSLAIALATTVIEQTFYRTHPTFDKPPHKVQTQVDTILYSPDSLKLFSIIITRIPETDSTLNREWYYNGSLVLGFRSRRETCWELYPEGRPLSPINSGSAENISQVMRSNYFSDEFRSVEMGIYQNGEQTFAPFKYNPTDSLFWTESLYWMKGAHIDSLYYFQTVRSPRPLNRTHARRKWGLQVAYPDSVREMYSQCGP